MEEAEDYAHDALLIYYEKKSKDKNESVLSGGWLYRTAEYLYLNTKKKFFQKERYTSEFINQHSIDQIQNHPEELIISQDLINYYLSKIDVLDKNIILLHNNGFTFLEISTQLSISAKTIEKRYSRAKIKIQRERERESLIIHTIILMPCRISKHLIHNTIFSN